MFHHSPLSHPLLAHQVNKRQWMTCGGSWNSCLMPIYLAHNSVQPRHCRPTRIWDYSTSCISNSNSKPTSSRIVWTTSTWRWSASWNRRGPGTPGCLQRGRHSSITMALSHMSQSLMIIFREINRTLQSPVPRTRERPIAWRMAANRECLSRRRRIGEEP